MLNKYVAPPPIKVSGPAVLDVLDVLDALDVLDVLDVLVRWAILAVQAT